MYDFNSMTERESLESIRSQGGFCSQVDCGDCVFYNFQCPISNDDNRELYAWAERKLNGQDR